MLFQRNSKIIDTNIHNIIKKNDLPILNLKQNQKQIEQRKRVGVKMF